MQLRIITLFGPIVLVDMDGVTVDFVSGLQQVMEQRQIPGFRRLAPAECTKYMIQDLFTGETHEAAVQICQEPGFFRDLPPFPGAIDAVTQMAELYQVYLCTAPYHENPTCASDKLAWVKRHLGRDWCDRVVLAGGDKTLVRGDILIDDKPVVTGNHHPTWKHLLFDNGCAYTKPGCGVVSINWQNWRRVIAQQLELRQAATF